MSEPLTMFDFTDCMVDADTPWLNEVGFMGDYPQPLEYPCNCEYCGGPCAGEGFDNIDAIGIGRGPAPGRSGK